LLCASFLLMPKQWHKCTDTTILVSLAVFFFGSMRSFTNGPEAVFEKRLIKQLLGRMVERELGD